ncbi:MAG: protein kinase [Thermodesulfobacteriota bacterium]
MGEDLKSLNLAIQAALKNKDWAAAVRLLGEWCDQRPEDPKAWHLRAYAFHKSGSPGQAERAVKKALALDPSHQEARKLLDLLTRQSGTSRRIELPARPGLWRKGQTVEGRYEVRGSKRGGMGEVYFAFDRELDRMVAIKTPLPEVFESEAATGRFFREAEAWIGLGLHPNICSAYYLRELEGLYRLFIEYVDGGSLESWLKDKPELTFRQRLDLAIQIAAGLNHTHTFPWKDEEGREHRGLVHRDLKPANVLLEKDGTARVTDFGLVGRGGGGGEPAPALKDPVPRPAPRPSGPARGPEGSGSHWHTVTVAGEAMGTPPYMAPEQWRAAHQVGFTADVYAFGCILFEIFCGRRPFLLSGELGQAPPELQMHYWEKMHLEETPPSPRGLRPDLDRELSDLMLSCLKKDPAERPPDFENIREQLKGIYRRVEGWRVPFLRPEPRATRLISDSLNNRGVSYLTLGRDARALEAWTEALQTDPLHVEAAYNNALYGFRRQGLPPDEACRRMAEIARTHAAAWRPRQLLGRLHLFFGHGEKASVFLKEAAGMDRTATRTLKDLGLALCARAGPAEDPGLLAEAGRILLAVRQKGAGDHHVAAGLYLARKAQGLVEEARRHYEKDAARYKELPPSPEEAVYRFVPGREVLFSVGLAGPVQALAVSPDGRTALVGLGGGLETWALRPVNPERTDRVEPAGGPVRTISISADGRLALASTERGPLRLIETATGRLAREISPPGGEVTVHALSPDGAFFAAVDERGTVAVFDTAAARVTASFSGPTAPTALACGPEGRLVLTGEETGAAYLWDAATGDRRPLPGHAAVVGAAAFTADGRFCLTGDRRGDINVWDAASGDRERAYALENPVATLAVSPDGRLALPALADPNDPASAVLTLMVLPGAAGYRPPYVLALPLSAARIEALEKEFQEKLEKARDHMAREYFQEAFEFLCAARALEGYHRAPEALEISRDLAARFPNQGLYSAWEMAAFTGQGEALTCLAVTPDGKGVLVGDQGGGLVLREIATGGRLKTLAGHTGAVSAVGVDARGLRAVSGAGDRTVRVWDLGQGEGLQVLAGHEEAVTAAALSPDGRFVLSAGQDGCLLFWDLMDGSFKELKGRQGPASSVCFSPDGRSAVSAGRDGTLRVWDLERSKCRRTLEGHQGPVTAVALSPDGLYVLSGGEDRTLRYWDLEAEDRVPRVFKGHEAAVTAVAVDPEGRFGLSGSADLTMRLWNLKDKKCARVFEGHHQGVTAVGFTPDDGLALSAGLDQTLRVWHLDWEPEVKPWAFWDEKARPYLESFLTLRTPYHQKGPARKGQAPWGEPDFQALLDELRNHGFGWLRPQGVRNELTEMSRYWDGPLAGPEGPLEKPSLKSTLLRPLKRLFHTVKGRFSLLTLLLPALVLAISIINIRRHSLFPVAALLSIFYFIIRVVVKRM